MSLFSALNIAASVLYAVIGFNALRKDSKNPTNRLFFLLSTLLALWAMANGFAVGAGTEHACSAVFNRFAFVWFFFPPLILHFGLRLTGGRRFVGFRALLLYLPGLLVYLFSRLGKEIVRGYEGGRGFWAIVYNRQSPWYYFNITHYLVYMIFVLILFIRWYRAAGSLRQRKQAGVILYSFLAGSGFAAVFDLFDPLFGISSRPPISPVFMLVWFLGIGFAITRYRLMTLNPRIAATTILDRIHDLVILCGTDERIIHINNPNRLLCSKTVKRLNGTHISGLLPLFSTRSLESLSIPGAEFSVDTECSGADGETIPLKLNVSSLFEEEDEQLGYIIIGHDRRLILSLEEERELHRRTAEELRASEEKFMKTFYLSPVGMALLKENTLEIDEINDSGSELLIIDKNFPNSQIRWMNEKHRERFLRELDHVDSVQAFAATLIRENGEVLECFVSADLVPIAGSRRILFCFVDISNRKRFEQELTQMQRFESIGILAGGIAHDFNNLLTSIIGNIGIIKLYRNANEETQEAIAAAESAVRQASRLTDQLLSFSKPDTPKMGPVDMRKVIEEAKTLALTGSAIEFKHDAADDLWLIQADEGQLIQVCNNILINAKQAIVGEKGLVSVETRKHRIEEFVRFKNTPLSLAPGRYVEVVISDNGPGIPRAQMKHIFDPYFSTKKEGSGLGLSIVYSIIKQHGGEVTVSSLEGVGTTFTLFLPVSDSYQE